jgi:hypothetical protein
VWFIRAFELPGWLERDVAMKLTKQLRIFLLYARGDQESVRRLYRRMLREGADVWLDREKLIPGQDWQYEIRRAIHDSDLVIVCLSRQFNRQGGYRHEELKIAVKKASSLRDGGVFIIPARLDECELPEPLRRWQRLDLFEPDGYKKLIGALRQYTASAVLTK